MYCTQCQTQTNNPKFCSRRCAVIFNNVKFPKKGEKKDRICQLCNSVYKIIDKIHSSKIRCPQCKHKRKLEVSGKKYCGRCKQHKLKTEFYVKPNNGLQRYCKPCFSKYCTERWTQKKIDMINLLGGKCLDCGQSFPAAIYDFHHLRDKEFSWNKTRLLSYDRMIQEINKCVLLCANCHRYRHYVKNHDNEM